MIFFLNFKLENIMLKVCFDSRKTRAKIAPQMFYHTIIHESYLTRSLMLTDQITSMHLTLYAKKYRAIA